MRDTDNPISSSFPSRRGSGYRICPICTRGFAGKPARQRTCSTRCSKEWSRSQKPKIKPPRFDVIEGRAIAVYDPDDLDAQDSLWRERGDYWESVAESARVRDKSAPLTIAGHGALVRVDGNSLVVRHGFTHYPHRRNEIRFAPRAPVLPQVVVLLACDGAVTVSALAWLARQRVPVVLLDERGNAAASFSGGVEGNIDLELRLWLRKIDAAKALHLARSLIAKKLNGQAKTVELISDRLDATLTLAQIRHEQRALDAAATIEQVRLAEARAAVAYFRLWTKLPMRWKGLNARPVTAEWFHVGMRGSASGASNRNATHPANAALNYTYAILQSQVSIACAQAGLDSTLGVLHAQRPGRPSLVLDLMEPLRPLADAKIVAFLRDHIFARADFPIGDDGVVRLHPQLARAVSALRLANHLVTQSVLEFVSGVTNDGQANPLRS